MKRKKYFNIFLVIGAICLLVIPSVQGVLYNKTISEEKNSNEKNCETMGAITYNNCVVWIYGKCKNVGGALTWIFGFYCPLLKKHLWIQASGQEGESLNVLVTGDGIGTYLSQENIYIELWGATGIMYWFGKSWFFEGDSIFARCKVDTCLVVTS